MLKGRKYIGSCIVRNVAQYLQFQCNDLRNLVFFNIRAVNRKGKVFNIYIYIYKLHFVVYFNGLI